LFLYFCVTNLCSSTELREVEKADGGFPLWLVIVLTLMSLAVIVVSVIVILAHISRQTTPAAVAVKGSAFQRMESGDVMWNMPSRDRRVWTSSHLQQTLPRPSHAVINVPKVSLVVQCHKQCYIPRSSSE